MANSDSNRVAARPAIHTSLIEAQGATLVRVTFFNADNKTAFEVHTVPVGTDAQKYALGWVERERRQGRPFRSYTIEPDSVQAPQPASKPI